MIKRNLFALIALVIAVAFWFFDASVHHFIYSEPQFEFVPSDFNELWMRVLIVLLILLCGILTDVFLRRLIAAHRKVEAVRIYKSMAFATHHILNNLLNQMQLFRMEAMKSEDFDPEMIKLYDNAIDEAAGLVTKLSHLEHITEEDIKSSVAP